MTGQSTDSRNGTPILGVAIAGFVLGTSFYVLDTTAQWLNLLDKTAWTALELLRTVIPLAGGQALPACFCEGSLFLQHLLQIGACIGPLLRVVAGKV